MRVFVTRGADFVGGHLAEHFAMSGHEVVVLDNFEPVTSLRSVQMFQGEP